MSDYQLKQFAIKAQEDARRCYKVYVIHRECWLQSDGDIGDVCVWQHRASVAAEHALRMTELYYLAR